VLLFALGVVASAVGAADGDTHARPNVDELARELSNPSTALASINLNFDYQRFQGDLPGAGDQDAWTMLFQPVFPFPQSNDWNVLFRPAIPIVFDSPVFDATRGRFEDSGVELGDIAFDLAYATTLENGLIIGPGLVGTLPTATGSLGLDSWRLGPELIVGLKRGWGVIGALVSHQWDVAGPDTDTSITGGQYFYAFSLGKGWLVAAGPTWSYDHNAPSGDKWTVPLGVGLSRTMVLGGRPWKFALQYWNFVARPNTFGPEHQVRLSISPVVQMPWSK
jgi:hypothetical protein